MVTTVIFTMAVVNMIVAKSMSSTSGWDESNMNNTVGNNQETNNKSGFNAFTFGATQNLTNLFEVDVSW